MLQTPRRSLPSLPFLAALIFVVISVAGGPAFEASPALQFAGTSRLQGRVYGEHGQNLAHVRVRLETSGGDLVVEASSDDQGIYSFGGLERGVYHLSASTDGYEPFRQTVDLTRASFRTIVDIGMSPLNPVKSPSDPPSLTDAQAPRKARQEYQKGMRDLAADRIPEAKVHFAKAVQRYPCYARAQTAVALGLVSDRELAGAEAALKKSIKCDPGYLSGYLKLGELYNVESRFRESAPLLQEGLRRAPGSWKFHYQLGVAYYGLGAYDKAQDEYLRSESLDPPAPPDVHVKLADVYFKKSLFRKAYAEMQAYLAAEPDGRLAGKVRDIIRQMEAYRDARAGTSSAATASTQH